MKGNFKKQFNCYCAKNHYFKFSTFNKCEAEKYCKYQHCYSPELV